MTFAVQMNYSAKCNECSELACGGCFDKDKERTIRCAIGCGWARAQDDRNAMYCNGCKGAFRCDTCRNLFTYLTAESDPHQCNDCKEKS